jgi:hypothetical protein
VDARRTFRGVLRRSFFAAVMVCLALASSATAALPAGQAGERAGTHKLIVTVEKTMAPEAEKKLAVLILISQDGGARAGALATPRKPLAVLQTDSGLYRIKAEIDFACKGRCTSPSFRIRGSADHTLEVVPSCRPAGSGFICSKVQIVRIN